MFLPLIWVSDVAEVCCFIFVCFKANFFIAADFSDCCCSETLLHKDSVHTSFSSVVKSPAIMVASEVQDHFNHRGHGGRHRGTQKFFVGQGTYCFCLYFYPYVRSDRRHPRSRSATEKITRKNGLQRGPRRVATSHPPGHLFR